MGKLTRAIVVYHVVHADLPRSLRLSLSFGKFYKSFNLIHQYSPFRRQAVMSKIRTWVTTVCWSNLV